MKVESTQAIVRANSHRAYSKLKSLCVQQRVYPKCVHYSVWADHGYIIPRSLREKALTITGIKEVKADYKKDWFPSLELADLGY